jgi:hypothetical protein
MMKNDRKRQKERAKRAAKGGNSASKRTLLPAFLRACTKVAAKPQKSR